MKLLIILTSIFSVFVSAEWLTDFEKAKKLATEKNECILLNFSGSDWCGPCIRMKKEIFESSEFTAFAEEKLVLVNADFPRSKKHQLSKITEKQNESLADKYNPLGRFPFTLLLDKNGKILKSWEGLPSVTPTEFVQQLKSSTSDER